MNVVVHDRLTDRLSWYVQVVLSAAALVVLAPLLLALALVVKLSSPGPVLYRGPRVGAGGRVFQIYKFRTLPVGAEGAIGARLLSDADKARYLTRVGRVLKRLKLDELPQLLNVLRGEMRLVGPRPLRPVFQDNLVRDVPRFAERWSVPPGITGIAQLRGGYYTSPRNKLRYDLIYIRNRGVRLDAQLILLTFVKVLNHWLTTGLFALVVFLFASFIPVESHPVLVVPALGVRVDVIPLVLVLAATVVFIRTGARDFSLYRTPLNLAIVLLVGASALGAITTGGPGWLLAPTPSLLTGLAVAFLIVNTLTTGVFISLTVRTIALTAVVMALVGLFEAFVLSEAMASGASGGRRPGEEYLRITSMLGSPVVLAVYLVLGIPLLLAEVQRARSRGLRDFWVACTTVAVLGVFFTQTRVGLLALLVAGAFFFWPRRAQAFAFAGAVAGACLLLVVVGLPRFAPERVTADVREWLEDTAVVLRIMPTGHWLFGSPLMLAGDAAPPAALPREHGPGVPSPRRAVDPADLGNMHLTLVLERGVAGWLIVMWVTLATLGALRRVHGQVADPGLRTVVWAIMAALVGFLVSMNGMNTFHSFPIQVFFWSLIGIGLGIVAHLPGRRRNMIWRFGDAGD